MIERKLLIARLKCRWWFGQSILYTSEYYIFFNTGVNHAEKDGLSEFMKR